MSSSAAPRFDHPSASQCARCENYVALQCDDRVFLIERANITANAPGSLFDHLFGTHLEHPSRDMLCNVTHPLSPFVFDRTAKYMEPLIQFVRTGELVIDQGVSRRGVLLEAQYFGMDAIIQKLGPVAKEEEFLDVETLMDHNKRNRLHQARRERAVANAELLANEVVRDVVPGSTLFDSTGDLNSPSHVATMGSDSHSTSTTNGGGSGGGAPHASLGSILAREKLYMEPASCSRQEIEGSLRTLPLGQGLRLRGMCFNGICFSKLDLRHACFDFCSLKFTQFVDCELEKASFDRADCTGAVFTRANLSGAVITKAIFLDANLEHAKCFQTNFTGSVMSRVKANQCKFHEAVLQNCDLSYGEFQGAEFTKATLRNANLYGVDRSGTSISMGGVIA